MLQCLGMPKHHEFDNEILTFCAGAESLVEATDCERNFLWQEHAVDAENLREYVSRNISGFPRVRWISHNMLLTRAIGHIGNRPICVQLARATVAGSVIIFWTMTSQLADYKMAEEYLTALFEKLNLSVRRTDATNFHNAF